MAKKNLKEMIKDAKKSGTIFYKFLLLIMIKMGFSNDELFPVQLRYKVYCKLRKKYAKFIKYNQCEDKKEINKTIWVMWLQGIDNAPLLVQRCYQSIIEKTKGWNVILVTKQNMNEYCNIPEYIIKKWEKNIISNTHMSDIIRNDILIKNGGLWIDSTVLLTDNIPDFITELDLFTFKHEYRYDKAVVFESWFIYSKKENPMLQETQKLLYKYWEKNNKLCEYFLFHLFFTLVAETYIKEWKCVPYFTDITPHNLYHEIFNKFSNNRYTQIKEQSFVHKLSYKLDIPEDITDTYYDKILKGDLD